jgi:AcrR family transcriptional regulator
MTVDPQPTRVAVSLRDRKKLRTRQILADTALRLFDADGYEATTVDDIARAADFGPATFFRHFPNKEEVAFPDAEVMIESFAQLSAQGGLEDPWTTITEVALRDLSESVDRDPERSRVRTRLWHQEPALARRYAEIWQGCEQGVAEILARHYRLDVDVDLYPRVAASAFIGALRAAVRKQCLHGGLVVEHAVKALDLVRPALEEGAPEAKR